MPSDHLRDDLPTYQESALARFLTARLMERARLRREALQRQPRRVRATGLRAEQRDSSPRQAAPDRPSHGKAGDRQHPRALPHDPVTMPPFDARPSNAEGERQRRQRDTNR